MIATSTRVAAGHVVSAFAAGTAWFFASAVCIRALPTSPWVTGAVLVLDAGVVVLIAWRLDLPVAATVGVASAVVLDWYSLPPTHPDLLPDASNSLALGAYLAMGSLLGQLAVETRSRAVTAEGARLDLEGEQAALRRVATLVARETPPEAVFALVAEEVGRILTVDLTLMVRYESDGTASVVASWSRTGPWLDVGAAIELDGGASVAAIERDTGAPASIGRYADVTGPLARTLRASGVRASVGSPILVSGGAWGAMIAASRTALLPEAGEERLGQFTELVASAVANAHARTELTESRRRIVTAADEARRHIERDLHDGVQQRLVSLALGVRLVQDTIDDGNDPAPSMAAMQQELVGTMEELRELSHGIHPAILSQGGLRPALASVARRSPVPVELVVRGGADRAPEEIEVGIYYVVSETLNNAAKHADARAMRVELDLAADHVGLIVTDDGNGGADMRRGSGLVGLADRITALGGEFRLTSPLGVGTTLQVRVPLDAGSADASHDGSDRSA